MKPLPVCLLILIAMSAAAQTEEPQYISPAGVKYYAQADAAGTVAEAEKNLAADPKDVDLLLALGRAQDGIWRFRESIATYTRGLELAPTTRGCWWRAGTATSACASRTRRSPI